MKESRKERAMVGEGDKFLENHDIFQEETGISSSSSLSSPSFLGRTIVIARDLGHKEGAVAGSPGGQ